MVVAPLLIVGCDVARYNSEPKISTRRVASNTQIVNRKNTEWPKGEKAPEPPKSTVKVTEESSTQRVGSRLRGAGHNFSDEKDDPECVQALVKKSIRTRVGKGGSIIEVDLSFSGWGDEVLVYVKGLPNLERLNLEGAKKVTDAGLAHLVGLKHLKSINLEKTSIYGPNIDKLKSQNPGLQVERSR